MPAYGGAAVPGLKSGSAAGGDLAGTYPNPTVNHPKQLGYAQITANVTNSTTTGMSDVAGLDVTVTVGSRQLRVTVFLPLLTNSATSASTYVQVYDVTAATVIQQSRVDTTVAGFGYPVLVIAANLTPGAGSREYKARWQPSAGTSTIQLNSASPAFILVEEL